MQRVAAGDQLAFSTLVKRYTPVIYPYLLYWLKQIPLAEEAAQDVFVRIWKNRHKLSDMENFPGYLYVTARNKANSALKELLTGNAQPTPDRLSDLLVNPQSSLELKELEAVLRRGIEALPPRRKEIFQLSRMEGMTYEEIAARLQISKHTVKEHVVAALVFLRYYLREYSGAIIFLMFGC